MLFFDQLVWFPGSKSFFLLVESLMACVPFKLGIVECAVVADGRGTVLILLIFGTFRWAFIQQQLRSWSQCELPRGGLIPREKQFLCKLMRRLAIVSPV